VLEQMMRLYHLPPGFRPVLPWYRSLEGNPRYDAILREREARIEQSRVALAKFEQASAAKTTDDK
jgi:hypothetical protein